MKHPKLRAELRSNEEWFFITLILTINKTSYRFYRNVKMTKDVKPTRNSNGLHLDKVVTIAEHACDHHVLKRVLKLSTYQLQVFLVKYEYLRSLQLCEDQGMRGKLKNVFANMCLRSLQLIGRSGIKKMHKTFATVKRKNFFLKSSAFHN